MVDPRKFDCVWLERADYESMMHRPMKTAAEPTPAATTAAPSAVKESKPLSYAQVAKQPAPAKGLCSEGKDLLADIEAARSFIRASIQTPSGGVTTVETLAERATRLEADNYNLKKLAEVLTKKLDLLETKAAGFTGAIPAAAPAKAAAKKEESDDDFAFSDDEDEVEAPKESSMDKMKRMAAEKKAEADAKEAAKGHTGPITKSICVFDIKPWSDETDMKELEAAIRSIEVEGLKWSTSELVEIGYGIKKLRIAANMVDHLVGLYDLEDSITAFEDFVQSVDIFSHNKI